MSEIIQPPLSGGRLRLLGQGRISARLITLLLSAFLVFLSASVISGYLLFRHEDALRHLFNQRLEHVMLAGELARDAEVLNAQIFERMLSHQKSQVDGDSAVTNQMAIFQYSRDKLAVTGGANAHHLADIDRLQGDYFASILALDESFRREAIQRQKDAEHSAGVLAVMFRLKEIKVSGKPTPRQREVLDALHTLLLFIASARIAEAPGQLHDLEEMATLHVNKVHLLLQGLDKSGSGAELHELAMQVQKLAHEVFALRTDSLLGGRATLSLARETRVMAQKLAATTVSHYLELRKSTHEDMAELSAALQHARTFIIFFSLFSALISLLAIAYIVREVAWRLRDLNIAMLAHVAGARVAIPQQGNDEIAEMGKAFEVFVTARDTAEAELQQNQSMLAAAAVTDSLSGLPNRRGFDETLEKEWKRAARNGASLAIVMADIDFFKNYNDHYGHLAGDECIRRFGEIIRQNFCRSVDYPARYGGEEFVCILPDTSEDGAAAAAGVFLQAVIEARIPHAASGVAEFVTVSIGVASVEVSPSGNAYAVIQAADEALYRAKSQGRNRVVRGTEAPA